MEIGIPAGNESVKDSLLQAINNNEIRSFAQPIYDLYSGKIFGYEMLARCKQPFESPVNLFRTAKDYNCLWELEYACRIASLNKIKIIDSMVPGLYYSINISPEIFNHPHFKSGFTLNYLQDLGLDHKRIILEITETASISNYRQFEEQISYYTKQGFRMAIDDFGAGHSGLITLVAMTPHIMKLDRALICNIDSNIYKQNLVKAFNTFASNVGSYLLAEGVETEEELKTVFRLGIRYAQGYLLGRPKDLPDRDNSYTENKIRELLEEFHYSHFTIDININNLISMPAVFKTQGITCKELYQFFQKNSNCSHIVITDNKKALGLITKQSFLSLLSGRYGFSVLQNKPVDIIMKKDFLTANNSTNIRTLEKMAMGRIQEDLYDPVIVINDNGEFLGTITMKQLLQKAFDLEIKLATSVNPLTKLPGNTIIGVWIENILLQNEYSFAYVDLDHFKEFNDKYGFKTGDEMIRLIARILARSCREEFEDIKLGHVGGDDFIMIKEGFFSSKFLEDICTKFDEEKLALFSEEERAKGFMAAKDRIGNKTKIPLTTISIGVLSSKNFHTKPHQGILGQIIAGLKYKVKTKNYKTGTSGFLFERRIYL